MPEETPDTLWVTAGPKTQPGRVALWERDTEHPGGEIYIAGANPGEEPQVVEAAKTPAVLNGLRTGQLKESKAPKLSAQQRKEREEELRVQAQQNEQLLSANTSENRPVEGTGTGTSTITTDDAETAGLSGTPAAGTSLGAAPRPGGRGGARGGS